VGTTGSSLAAGLIHEQHSAAPRFAPGVLRPGLTAAVGPEAVSHAGDEQSLLGVASPGSFIRMRANPTIGETVARWRALEPSGRRSLLMHLVRLLAMSAALYVIAAVMIFQSWWWPAVAIALGLLASSLVQRFRRSPRSRG
jgi:hypothetical protein